MLLCFYYNIAMGNKFVMHLKTPVRLRGNGLPVRH